MGFFFLLKLDLYNFQSQCRIFFPIKKPNFIRFFLSAPFVSLINLGGLKIVDFVFILSGCNCSCRCLSMSVVHLKLFQNFSYSKKCQTEQISDSILGAASGDKDWRTTL